MNYFGFRKWYVKQRENKKKKRTCLKIRGRSKFKSPICTYSREVFERGNLERLHRIKRHTNNKLKSVGSGESDDEDGSQVENESKIGNETTEEEEESRHEDAQLLMKLMAKKEQSGDSTPSGSPLSDESSRTIASPGGMFPHLPEINKARQSQGPARLPSLCDLFRIGRQQQTAMERCSENDGNYFNERNSLTPSEAAKLDYSPLSDLQSSRMSGGFDRGIGSSYTDSDNVMRRARGPNFNESDNAMRPVPAFLKFLYTMVNDQSQSIVTWAEEGKAFTINNLNTLPSLLLRYFRHGKYSSFQRQLNMYGFKKWSKAPGSKRTYTHPYFRQGGQNHLWKIKRHNRAQQNRGHAA